MKKNIFKSLCLFIAMASLSSCLKDDSLVLDPDKGTNVVEFQNMGEIAVHGSTTALYTLAYEIKPTATLVPVVVSYSGPSDGAPEDITVNVGVGPNSVISQYNAEQGRTGVAGASNEPLIAMPSNLYALQSTSVVIPKGGKTATFNVALNLNAFTIGIPYALPLKITSVSSGVISANFSNILFNPVPKNKYDGIYQSLTGTIQRYSAPGVPTVGDALNGDMAGNPDVRLVTTGANTNQLTGLNWARSGGGVGGVDPIFITVDPATNLVTVSSNGAPSMKTIPGKENKYDPATKTYTLNFDWNQTSNKREVLNLTIKFKGARP